MQKSIRLCFILFSWLDAWLGIVKTVGAWFLSKRIFSNLSFSISHAILGSQSLINPIHIQSSKLDFGSSFFLQLAQVLEHCRSTSLAVISFLFPTHICSFCFFLTSEVSNLKFVFFSMSLKQVFRCH